MRLEFFPRKIPSSEALSIAGGWVIEPSVAITLHHPPGTQCQMDFQSDETQGQGRLLSPNFDKRLPQVIGPLMENKIWWKTTFGDKQSLMDDDLWLTKNKNQLKITMSRQGQGNGRQLLMEDDLWYRMSRNSVYILFCWILGLQST